MEQTERRRIGQILKDRRLRFGYTQEFAAEKAGISYSYYTKIERGEQLPSLEVCVQLAKTFRLSLDQWIGNSSFEQNTLSPELFDLNQYLETLDAESIRQIAVLLQKVSLVVK